MNTQNKTQLERFKEAARELEADDDDERFNERLRKLAKQKLTHDSNSESNEGGGEDG